MSNRELGVKENKLLRYKLIVDLYNKHKTEDIPTTVVLRKYIRPIYPISRTTLYNILNTPVEREFKALNEQKAQQLRLSI